ncbi:hypothetical protein R75465_06582 [Paraburkholderia aspalathi]|nr:hypothetical protein R75465_06582 [Paraburkholderia aspalathi]
MTQATAALRPAMLAANLDVDSNVCSRTGKAAGRHEAWIYLRSLNGRYREIRVSARGAVDVYRIGLCSAEMEWTPPSQML